MESHTRRKAASLVNHLATRSTAMTHAQVAREFSRSALRTALDWGTVTRLAPNVYVATERAEDPIVRLRAASAWAQGRGAVTGAAALAVWGYRDDFAARITVQLRPSARTKAPPWIRVVRPDCPSPVLRVKGVLVVEGPYAVVQAWNERVGGDGVSVVIGAVKRNMRRERIAEAAGAMPRVRARAKLMALLDLLDGGITSYLEWIARTKVFTRERFPDLIWQHTVPCHGRNRRPDAYDEEAKIDLEFDGAGTHSSDSDRRRDLERDADLASIGVLTLHFTMEDLLHRPEWCVRRYLEARAARIGA